MMRPTQQFLLTILTLLWLPYSAAGQSSSAQPHIASLAPSTQAAAKSRDAAARPKLSDQALEAKIRAKFAKSKSANQFRVRVQGGVATIEGKTEVIQHKGAATRMAKVAGAALVNNKVEVSEAAKKRAAGNLGDGRRRVEVKRTDTRSFR